MVLNLQVRPSVRTHIIPNDFKEGNDTKNTAWTANTAEMQ